jgi:hypothetical protein
VVHGGSRGVLRIYAVAVVPNTSPSKPQMVTVRIQAQPAARVALRPLPGRLLVGQRITPGADVFAANGDLRDDRLRWTSSAPARSRRWPPGRRR